MNWRAIIPFIVTGLQLGSILLSNWWNDKKQDEIIEGKIKEQLGESKKK